MRLLELAVGSIMLRHDDAAVDLGARHVLYGVHHRGRDANGDYHNGDAPGMGDVVGSVLYVPETGGRPLPAISFAMPVVVTRPQADRAGTTLRNAGPFAARPIYDERLNADTRLAEVSPKLPEWASKLPKGWVGSVSAAMREDGQPVPVLTPGALGTIAANHAGDGALSTAVLDLDDENRPDPKRRALVGTIWDVVRGFGGGNSIAWRWARSRSGVATRGLVAENGASNQSGAPADQGSGERVETPGGTGDGRTNAQPNGNTNKAPLPQGPPPITIGHVSGPTGGQVANVAASPSGPVRLAAMTVFEGGPVDAGDPADQHQIGVDADGRGIGPAHVSTLALVRGQGGDGPIAFEAGPWPDLSPGNFLTPCHIRFNPNVSHVWGPGRTGAGVWGVFAEGYFYVPDPPRTPPDGPEGPPPTGPRTPPTPRPGGGDYDPTQPGGGRLDPPAPQPPPTPSGPRPGGGQIGPGGGTSTTPDAPKPPPTEPGREQPDDPDAVDEYGHARTPAERERAKREREERERRERERRERPPGKPSGSIDAPIPPPIPSGGRLHPVDDPARPGDSQPFPPFPGAPVDPGRRQRPQDGDEMEGERRREEEDRRRFVTGTRYDDARPLVASPTEIAVPGIVIRPQHFGCGRPDLRNQVRSRAEDVAQHDAAAPAVMRTEGAFARAGDTCNAGDPTFTHRKGRYRVGTASGTVADFPAEVGFEDASVSYSPGFALSTVYRVGLAGSLHYGTGLPDPMGGAPKSGQMWGQVTAGGALVFRSTTSAGAVSKTRTLPEADGTIALVETSPLKGIRFSNGTFLRSFSVADATLNDLALLVYTACYDLETTGSLDDITVEDDVGTFSIDSTTATLVELADFVGTAINQYKFYGYLPAVDYAIANRRTRFKFDCTEFTMGQLADVVAALLTTMGVGV